MSCTNKSKTENKNGEVDLADETDALEEGASLLEKLKRPDNDEKKDDNSDEDDNEVIIVPPPLAVSPAKATHPSPPKNRSNHASGSSTTETEVDDDDEDEIQVTGTFNATYLPHMRCHCTVYPFQTVVTEIDLTANGDDKQENKDKPTSKNTASCDLCYCYICDAPVKECPDWKEHCDATDKSGYWTNVRKRKRSESRGGSFVATLDDGRILRWLIECIILTQNAGYFTCTEQGLTFSAKNTLDNSTFLSLPRAFFGDYECENPPLKIGIPDFGVITRWLKGFKTKKDGPVFIRATPNESFYMRLGGTGKELFHDTVDNIRVDEDIPESSMFERGCTFCFSLGELKKMLKVILLGRDSIDGYLTITCKKEGLLQFELVKPFKPEIILQGAKFTFKNVKLEWNDPAQETMVRTVHLDDIGTLVDKVPLSLTRNVRIGIKNDGPVELEFSFRDHGRMTHFIYHIDKCDMQRANACA